MKVWITSKPIDGGKKTSYALRWICPVQRKWKSRRASPGGKTTCTDKRIADREASKLAATLDDGTYRAVSRVDWQSFTDEHVARKPGKKNKVAARYALDSFHKKFPAVNLRQITFGLIEEFAESMRAKGNKQSTINNRLRYLRHAFNMAVRRGYLGRNPMEDWTWEKANERKARWATKAEREAVLTHAEALYGYQWWAMVKVAMHTGARRGELLSLEWRDVDTDAREVAFRNTKGKRDRDVPFDPELDEVFLRLQAITQQDGGPFRCWNEEHVRQMWKRTAKAAGVNKPPNLRYHDLRSTYVRILWEGGTDLVMASKLVGHRDIKTTERYYTWFDMGDKRAAVDRSFAVAAG